MRRRQAPSNMEQRGGTKVRGTWACRRTGCQPSWPRRSCLRQWETHSARMLRGRQASYTWPSRSRRLHRSRDPRRSRLVYIPASGLAPRASLPIVTSLAAFAINSHRAAASAGPFNLPGTAYYPLHPLRSKCPLWQAWHFGIFSARRSGRGAKLPYLTLGT